MKRARLPLSQQERTGPWKLIFAALLLTLLLASGRTGTVSAAPNDQEFIRQQERERLLRQQQESTPDVRLQQETETQELFPEGETPCFPINQIELTGEDAEDFQWALESVNRAADRRDDPILHRCLGTQGINLAMRRIQNAIVDRGFVTTRILAGAQDLSSGTLQLTVVPGRIRTIRFAQDSTPWARQWNAVPARPGDLLNLRDIEQALENFKRPPSAEADIQITPAEGEGAQPGESDLVIAWKQGFPLRLTLSVDDSGTEATGKYQGSATLSWDNMLTLNDLFYFSANHDLMGEGGNKGTEGGTLHYSLPFGYWLLGFTASRYDYHQSVAGTSQNYIYSGRSDNESLELSRVIHRDATRKISLSVNGWARTSNNYIDDTEVTIQRRRMGGWGAGINDREFIGSSTLDLALDYTQGTGAFDSLPAPEELFDDGTSRPRIFSASARLTLPFSLAGQQFSYNADGRAQWTETVLVPLDRFSIGGRYTVRGFDGENTLMADRGWLLRNDLSWMLGSSSQALYLALDHGEVGGTHSDELVGKQLTGSALGLRGMVKGVHYDLFAGVPVKKPDGFETADIVTGFTLTWSF